MWVTNNHYLILYIIVEVLRSYCHVRKNDPLTCCPVYNLFFKRPAWCNVLGESYKNPTCLLKKKKKNLKQTYAAERKGKPRKRTIEKELRSVIDGGEKNSEKKVRFYHHQTIVPSTRMVFVFLYRRSMYSLPL